MELCHPHVDRLQNLQKLSAAARQPAAFVITYNPGLITCADLTKFDSRLIFPGEVFNQLPEIDPAAADKINNNPLASEHVLGIDYLHRQLHLLDKPLAALHLLPGRGVEMFFLHHVFRRCETHESAPIGQRLVLLRLAVILLNLLWSAFEMSAAIVELPDKLTQLKAAVGFYHHPTSRLGYVAFLVLKPAQVPHSAVPNQHQLFMLLRFVLCFTLCHVAPDSILRTNSNELQTYNYTTPGVA